MSAVRAQDLQARRLLQFLLVLRVLAAAFGTFQLAVALVTHTWTLIPVTAATYTGLAATIVSRWLVRRGRLKEAALLAGYGLLLIAAVASPLAPYGTAALELVAVVAVAVVLPYVRGRELSGFLLLTFAAMLWIAASGAWLGHRFQVPPEVAETIGISSVAAPAILVLLLLYQFSQQLRSTLDAEREARRKAEQAHAEAIQAIAHRDEFLAVASHELRTPLTSLQLTVQALRRGKGPHSPEGLDRSLALIERQIVKLVSLVTDMLTIGRIQEGRLVLRLEPVDLAQVAREVVARFEPDLARTGSPLSLKAAPAVGRWDRDKLDQVVTNLLGNSIKFGQGKPIELSVEARADLARLVVADHGIGIAPEHLRRVFGKFERATSARAYGGLGLGLFITRTIVEALGGSVRAESPGHGGGATFTVELPRAGPATA